VAVNSPSVSGAYAGDAAAVQVVITRVQPMLLSGLSRNAAYTLTQTMQYGTPLAQSLRVTSAELRNDTLVKLEERANRLPVLMTVPMIVLLPPAVFLAVGGPAVLHLIDVVGR
jgi:pilus assembly protein TadC